MSLQNNSMTQKIILVM